MYITIEEMKTHLYKEDVDLISGGDDTIMLAAIDTATAEIRSYLGKYDRDAIFGAEGKERNALLLTFAKDIAAWHFLTLCNVGSDLDFRHGRYARAIDWLKAVQKGDVSPDLPMPDEDGDGEPDQPTTYLFGSNPKRNNHY
ncbi:MAG: DUF1320 family protein [Bacteroidales bacterium]|uniref:phage protein Gp36 family protein n=1 Tax=Porphyromonas sp. TaxID=1924944 RepID=UPI00297609B3|nr:phage protein Gp36 family protein [Porphyromonas sp.]MDD7438587.1 DUF1320 family protein [Bacteroidales bacterium]